MGGSGTTDGHYLEASDWLTLKEASEATGVPTDTIRKWARNDHVPSFLEKTEEGHLRIVSMEGIRRWAAEIGRDLDVEESGEQRADMIVDLAPEPGEEPGAVITTEDRPAVGTSIPEGSMLVPLDAWNKVLNQLGNLHEAGQQLAEARERAAKAETEARFLKERLAEMRSELERTREAVSAFERSHHEPGDETGERRAAAPTRLTLGGTAGSLAAKIYQGWRERRRRA